LQLLVSIMTRIAELDESREAHRAAVVWAVLFVLWGGISLLIVPWRVFLFTNVSQTVVGAAALLYLACTWRRPARVVADTIIAAFVVYALVFLPWASITWCRLGYPVEAFTVPQVAIVSIALLLRARWPLVVAATSLFILESFVPFVYARHAGLAHLLPINEPLATVGISAVGGGLLVLRRHRQQQARRYVRLRAELNAIDQMRPALAHTISELEEPLLELQRDVPLADRASVLSRCVGSTLDRLGRLRGQLAHLTQVDAPSADAEQRYLDRDAQYGALVFAALMTAISVGTTWWVAEWVGSPLTVICALNVVLDLTLVLTLATTRDQPSARRALFVVVVIMVTSLAIANAVQVDIVAIGRPYIAFVSHKYLMCTLGLTLTTRFRLGLLLIGITATNAAVLWFGLDLAEHRALITNAEPFATLIFMLIGVLALRMLEQRKLASIQLLRAEAAASGAQRSAAILFALHDRLNSPLQTLTLAATAVTRDLPVPNGERVQQSIDRLVELSRELAAIDLPVPHAYPLTDSNDELRRHA
jgi:hypothetical protein